MDYLIGVIERIVYRNAENGYTVAVLETEGKTETIVGTLPLVSEGEQIEVEGDYENSIKHGRQFSVSSFVSSLPVDETSILRYLSSGIIKGVRAKTAKLLVDRFGPNTLDVIENSPASLTLIKGITMEKAVKISQSMKENIGVKSILIYFQQFGITPAIAFRIYRRFGLASYDILRANPYRICEVQGVSFEKADRMAEEMGFDRNDKKRSIAGIEFILKKNLYDSGHTFLPKEKLAAAAAAYLSVSPEEIAEILEEMTSPQGSLVYISSISNTDAVYLKYVYDCERHIADRVVLANRMNFASPPQSDRPIHDLEKKLNLTFAEKQVEAIRESLYRPMMILTGGPGTGKTTTLNGIIRLLEDRGEKVGIASPTGRAAKRITELTGRTAKTLHRLLEYTLNGEEGVFQRNEDNLLEFDTVIVDECSMVDLWLFERLLAALPVTSRLILVGDVNQLPPVGPGSILKDLIRSQALPVIELTEIFRQAQESLIITNAHRVLQGEFPILTEKKKDFFFLPADDPTKAVELTVDLAARRLPNAYGFSSAEEIQVLCPSRKGFAGTVRLNDALKEAVNPEAYNKKELQFRSYLFRESDKVMQIRNNYDIITEHDNGTLDAGVYNGDIGTVQTVLPNNDGLIIRYDDKIATYTPDMLEELEPAYAITVHKSQGSEFPAVILVISEGADLLYTRNLLYTAITRAKNILVAVGSKERIAMMVREVRSDKRFTGLKAMIKAQL